MNYTEDQLRWHIENNFIPGYSNMTIDAMIATILEYQEGKISIGKKLNPRYDVTVYDLITDLKLEL